MAVVACGSLVYACVLWTRMRGSRHQMAGVMKTASNGAIALEPAVVLFSDYKKLLDEVIKLREDNAELSRITYVYANGDADAGADAVVSTRRRTPEASPAQEKEIAKKDAVEAKRSRRAEAGPAPEKKIAKKVALKANARHAADCAVGVGRKTRCTCGASRSYCYAGQR